MPSGASRQCDPSSSAACSQSSCGGCEREMSDLRREGNNARLLRRLALVGLVLLASSPAWAAGSADTEATALERKVKAAFVYKFADFVEWPDAAFARAD